MALEVAQLGWPFLPFFLKFISSIFHKENKGKIPLNEQHKAHKSFGCTTKSPLSKPAR
jgi:hypothetical protein